MNVNNTASSMICSGRCGRPPLAAVGRRRDHNHMQPARAVRAEDQRLLDVGRARRAGDQVDDARQQAGAEFLAQPLQAPFRSRRRRRAASSTTMWLSGRKLSVVGLSGPDVSTSVPVSATRAECVRHRRELAAVGRTGRDVERRLALPWQRRQSRHRRRAGPRAADCAAAGTRRSRQARRRIGRDRLDRRRQRLEHLARTARTRSASASCPRSGTTPAGWPLQPIGNFLAARRFLPVTPSDVRIEAKIDVARAHRRRPSIATGSVVPCGTGKSRYRVQPPASGSQRKRPRPAADQVERAHAASAVARP